MISCNALSIPNIHKAAFLKQNLQDQDASWHRNTDLSSLLAADVFTMVAEGKALATP